MILAESSAWPIVVEMAIIALALVLVAFIGTRKPKHRHQWEETSREYHPPLTGMSSLKVGNVESAAPYVYGITVVGLRCSGCGEIASHQFTGKVGINA